MVINAEWTVAACSVAGLLGGWIAWALYQKDKAQQIELEGMRREYAQRDKILALEMQRLVDSSKAAWEKIDKLKEERGQFWTRDEHDKWRAEMKAERDDMKREIREDMKELGDRLIKEVEKVSNQFSKDIANILKNCAVCKE